MKTLLNNRDKALINQIVGVGDVKLYEYGEEIEDFKGNYPDLQN